MCFFKDVRQTTTNQTKAVHHLPLDHPTIKPGWLSFMDDNDTDSEFVNLGQLHNIQQVCEL